MQGMILILIIYRFFVQNIPELLEVSIGHALISDALYHGLRDTIQMYLRQIKIGAKADSSLITV